MQSLRTPLLAASVTILDLAAPGHSAEATADDERNAATDIRSGIDPDDVGIAALGKARPEAAETPVAAGDRVIASEAFERDGFSIRSSWSTPNPK